MSISQKDGYKVYIGVFFLLVFYISIRILAQFNSDSVYPKFLSSNYQYTFF